MQCEILKSNFILIAKGSLIALRSSIIGTMSDSVDSENQQEAWIQQENEPKHQSKKPLLLKKNLPDERPLNVILDEHLHNDPGHVQSSRELKHKKKIKSKHRQWGNEDLFCPADALMLLPDKPFNTLLEYLSQKDVRKLRLASRKIHSRIKPIYIFNATLCEENLRRKWTSGTQLPWYVDNGRHICNKIHYLRVGSLKRTFKEDLAFVGTTVKEIELCGPISNRNLQHIMKSCKECSILRVHAAIFRGNENTCSCMGKFMSRPKINLNHLKKLYIIFDISLTASRLSTIGIQINLANTDSAKDREFRPPDMIENRRGGKDSVNSACEVFFLPKTARSSKTDSLNCEEGAIGMEPMKTWVVDDETMDFHGRPECLRKLSYFAMVNTANLCQISISFNLTQPPVIPSVVKCSKRIHHPCFYPQRHKYLSGPFNGTFLTYVSSKEKSVMPFHPIGNLDGKVNMSFPEAASAIVPQRPGSFCS